MAYDSSSYGRRLVRFRRKEKHGSGQNKFSYVTLHNLIYGDKLKYFSGHFLFHTGHKLRSPGSKPTACLTRPPAQRPPGVDFLSLHTTSSYIVFSLTSAPNNTRVKLHADSVTWHVKRRSDLRPRCVIFAVWWDQVFNVIAQLWHTLTPAQTHWILLF